jgi:hypothetical protein
MKLSALSRQQNALTYFWGQAEDRPLMAYNLR